MAAQIEAVKKLPGENNELYSGFSSRLFFSSVQK